MSTVDSRLLKMSRSRCEAGSVREQFEEVEANERVRERNAGKDMRPQGRYRVSP